MAQQNGAQKPMAGIHSGQMLQQKAGAVTGGEEVWDEEHLEKAMTRLKEMHIQVCQSLPYYYLSKLI